VRRRSRQRKTGRFNAAFAFIEPSIGEQCPAAGFVA
jgi:hypothetical protein